MKQLLVKLWKQQDGIIVSSEIILIGTILVLGSIAGLSSLQYAISGELNDCAHAVDNTNLYGQMTGDYAYNNGVNSQANYQMTDSPGVREVAGDSAY